MSTAIARNAPCPCGSGKRFKDCHGAVASAPATQQSADELLRQAQVAFASGDSARCVMLLRQLIECDQENVAAWNLLGEALLSGDATAAIGAWWQALSRDLENAEASFHLGNRNRERGEHGAAVIHYERALRGAPGHAGLLNNLGLSCVALGELSRAEECYRAVLALEPQHTAALVNLANLLFQRERYAELLVVSERLLAHGRNAPPAIRLMRALAQERLGNVTDAEASLRQAVSLWPGEATPHAYLGMLYMRRRRYAEAEPPLLRSLELAPNSALTLSVLAHARQQQCAWSGLSDLFSHLEALTSDEVEGLVPIDAFSALAMPLSPSTQLQIAHRSARRYAGRNTPRPKAEFAPGKRLRVGFASADFRPHPTVSLITEFLERIDLDRIETFGYGLFTRDSGPVGRRVECAFEHFVDVSADSAPDAVQRIREDRIDILLDLNGYTDNARPEIFALRPAPLQVNGIGFQGTLGAPWYDYILTDRFGLPQVLQHFYTEDPLYMPHSAFPSDTTRLPAANPPSRTACDLPERGFVFCCFNNAYKILPETFAIWMRLLAKVRDSVLWLLETSNEAKTNLRREAQAAGIDPQRLIFAPRIAVGEHVARNAAADLFLDTYPYGAHTTANDALLSGLPVLTRVGQTLASRIAGSQLHAVGLPELVTQEPSEYESLALELATRPELLAGYRRRLAANRRAQPLFDMVRYARDFEDAMLRVWDEHRARYSQA